MKSEYLNLGDIIIVQKGYAFKPKDYTKKGIRIIRVTNLNRNDFSDENSMFIDEIESLKYERYQLKENDAIISTVGSWPSNPDSVVGKVSIVKKEIAGCLLNQNAVIIRAKEGCIQTYLNYILLNESFKNYIIGTAQGSASQASITLEDIKKYRIKLPNITIQKQVSAILSALDDKIELNARIIANLEQQAQAIFQSWFVDFEPYGGKMPKDWKKDKLGSFVDIKRGGSPRPIQDYLSDKGYRWLKISDVTSLNSPYILEIKEHIREEGLTKTVFLKQGSLVLSNSATPGIPKILDVDSCIHDGWLYFPDSQLSNEYLYLLFTFIRNDLVKLGNGSVFTNLKTDILRQFEIIMPTGLVLSKFQDIITPLFEMIKNNTRENQRLAALRDALLPKLMNGEIDVSDVKI